jgi:NTP pyrophosphatase (non-canonical NTP hydrolase)
MENSLEHLQKIVRAFCEMREWDQFHTAKDLAIGVSTEAGELLDLFRFKTDAEIKDRLGEPEFRRKVEHELADVFFFILRFAQMNGIDLSEALRAKMEVNASKYPVATAKGSNRKYNE